MADPELAILLTTYKRTSCAVKTIEALRKNLLWGNISWWVSDDGSSQEHIDAVMSAIGPTYSRHFFNSLRLGVGRGMNQNLKKIFETIDLVLVMEDDWELSNPLDLRPFVDTLLNHNENGMIRFGYLSTNILGYTVAYEKRLYWRIEYNGETYRFTGHPSLRHKRFHQGYGYYDEGLPPGMTELSMCGKVNQAPGPNILFPTDCNGFGFFAHIGSESLADMEPTK